MSIVKRSKTAIINFPRYPSKYYDLKIGSGSTKYVSKEYHQIYFLTNYMYLPTHNEERDGNRTFFNSEQVP